ncbi:MAG TPA: MarR family transcriptional regulator [Candidatus Merdibacter merdipullorum]|nr:MarR family transcriptional regulator [Candidatus Merdibacter merdipullorum]
MEKSFNLMMFRLHQSSRSRLRPGMTKAGLSSGQPKVLLYVRDHDACRMKDVSRYCSITPATASKIIEKLQRDGFLECSRKTDDRRSVFLHITKKGEEALVQWEETCARLEEEMLQGFDRSEQDQFYDFLLRAYDNLNEGKGDEQGA